MHSFCAEKEQRDLEQKGGSISDNPTTPYFTPQSAFARRMHIATIIYEGGDFIL